MLAPISELLTRCKLSTADITNVVLAGGTTKVRISKNHYQLSEMTERLVLRTTKVIIFIFGQEASREVLFLTLCV